ncbi:MAG: trypsin-like peptidase domain-containing protein [Planctomycetota bacterium]|nr:trypsin-like peptidase domain-containing protein [Planctomycetota bacterium]
MVGPSVARVEVMRPSGTSSSRGPVVGKVSGAVTAWDGFIATNSHVAGGAIACQVSLPDGSTYLADVLGDDASTDLAILRVEAKDLSPIPLGDSNSLEVGEWVMAIGNPLGLQNTYSTGIVSALGCSSPPSRRKGGPSERPFLSHSEQTGRGSGESHRPIATGSDPARTGGTPGGSPTGPPSAGRITQGL